jgi:hypothetical protein
MIIRNKKAFCNGMCPVSVTKIDIKQIMKYIDHDLQDLDFCSAVRGNQQRRPGQIKYWAKNENSDLKCKLKLINSSFDK